MSGQRVDTIMEDLEVMDDMIQCIMSKGKVICKKRKYMTYLINKTNCPLKNVNQPSKLECEHVF